MIRKSCYACYRDLSVAPEPKWTVGGFIVCRAACVQQGLLRWWATSGSDR